MRDDPIGALELELVAAARRRTARASRPGWRPTAGGSIAAAAVLVALVVGVGSVLLLGRHGGSGAAGVPSRATTGESFESVPLTLESRVSAVIGTAGAGPANSRKTETVMWQLLRSRNVSATTTAGAVLLPGRARVELWEVAARLRDKRRLDVLAAVVRGNVLAHAPAAEVLARGLVFAYDRTPTATRVAVVVPNEVARVRLLVPGARSKLAAVHRNIASFELEPAQRAPVARVAHVIWYGRDGQVIRRVGPESP